MDYTIETESQILALEILEVKDLETDRFMEIIKKLKKEMEE